MWMSTGNRQNFVILYPSLSVYSLDADDLNISIVSLLKQHTMEEGEDFSLCGKAAVTEANLSRLKTFKVKSLYKQIIKYNLHY